MSTCTRPALTFTAVMAIGATIAQLTKAVRPTFGTGYATGVAVMLAAAFVLNSRPGDRA